MGASGVLRTRWGTCALWEQAADAFARIDAAPVAAQVKRDAAYAAVLAWKNALGIEPRDIVRTTKLHDSKPRAIPARALKLLGSVAPMLSRRFTRAREIPYR